MAPKKSQKKEKMSLGDFLTDDKYGGSWADDIDDLPSAPALRTDEGRSGHRGERDFGARGDDFQRESRYPPREELPLPTAPPYTAFIGNLPFDLSERDVEDFFSVELKSVKIIRDRDDKPKGFGYVEFVDLEGLKDGLAKSGRQLLNRNIRVSVAEPPKERERPGGFDDDKFSGSWRREGPLQPSGDRRGPSSRFDDNVDRGERMGFGSKFVPSGSSDRPARGGGFREKADLPPSEAETTSDWRGKMRPPPTPTRTTSYGDRPQSRRPSGVTNPDAPPHPSETDDTWAKGSRFVPSESQQPESRRSSFFARKEPNRAEEDLGDWRSGPRKAPAGRQGSYDQSPGESVPSTPTMGRRKLDVLPRSASQSYGPSPVGSPKSASAAPATRPNPFGAAKPVDVAAREREIEEKLLEKSKTQESLGRASGLHPMERSGSNSGSWRGTKREPSGKPFSHSRQVSRDAGTSPTLSSAKPATAPAPASSKYRPQFSFAAAASGVQVEEGEDDEKSGGQDVDEVANKVSEIAV